MKIKTVKQHKLEQQALLWGMPGQKSHRSLMFKDFPSIMSTKEDASNGDTIATGYLNAFGNKDSHKDIVHKGAFAKSIQERGPESNTPRKIAFLYAHNMSTPVGQFTKLVEMDAGLYYEGKLDMVPFVKDTIIPQMKSGTLNNHSIGYNYVWEKGMYDEDKDEYHWKELETFEGSVLTMGSNEMTPFLGFKDFQSLDAVNDLADKANSILRTIGDYKKEFELRDILQKYQSLLEHAAEEITAYGKKPKKMDLKYIADNFKL
jgi:HK97 family phage prohead protease